MPQVTVLMPVRNGEKYIAEAIESVLAQSFEDFELLIMDDGSTDGTLSIIRSLDDPRIRLVEREPDFIATLNAGLSLARGELVARMDADDLMHTERLRIQHKRMTQNPDITVCATWIKPFRDDGAPMAPFQSGGGYIDNFILRMLRGNILAHPSVMIRKSFLQDHGLQYENYPQAEDYKLWLEVAKAGGVIFVEPQTLLNFRISETQVTNVKRESMERQTAIIKKEILSHLIATIDDNKNLLELQRNLEALEAEGTIIPNETFQIFWGILIRKMGLSADNFRQP